MTHRTPKVLRVLEAMRALPPLPPERPRTRGSWGVAADGGLIAERDLHAPQSAVLSTAGEAR